jgi:DNA-binding LacI/PurR family transcriptional regulator
MLVSSMLTQENRPTALLCTNDTIAVGAMKAVLRAGLRIPQDMSVIGYDNSDLCMICEPELTSVAVDMSKMGRLSVEYLLAQINGQTPDQKIVTVDSKLILRGTTN